MDTQELNRQNFDSSLAGSPTPEAVGSKAEECGEGKLLPSVLENLNTVATNWVEAHGDYLFNFAVGQMRDTNVAEDLVQETFLAALKSQSNFSGRSSERTWLTGILRHKIYNHLRRSCRERAMRVDPPTAQDDGEEFDESLLWIHQIAAESTSPTRRLELGEFREHLVKAMSKLPPRIAQVFQLYSIEECTNQEVCSRLNISESNLWVMLHRARKQLSEAFAGWRDFAQTRQQKGVAARNSRRTRGPRQEPTEEVRNTVADK
jgi:RNA polymerase sigma-70 factor (TIGR02943 family)